MLRYGWENFHLAWLSSDSLYEALWWRIGRHIVKVDDGGGPSTDQVGLWVRFRIVAGSSHTKDSKKGSDPCLHDIQDEVGTTKCDWVG